MNKKNTILTILIAVLALVGVYFAFFTGVSTQSRQIHARWISAHTSGTVSAHTPVKVYFTRDMVTKEQTGVAVSKEVFKISPSVKGRAIWVQPNVLEFAPDKTFKNGKNYEVTIDLSEVIDSLNVDNYVFSFDIIQQNFTVDVEGLTPVDMRTSELLRVYGNVALADKASDEVVRNILVATINKKDYPVKWTADNSGRYYNFTIDSIPRIESQQILRIAYDGEAIGVDYKGETSYKIPSKDDFVLTGYRIQQHPEQQVKLYFSDAVKRYQDLTGLIRFVDIKDYKIDVSGNVIIIHPTSRQTVTDQLRLSKGIVSASGKISDRDTTFTIVFEELKPAVRSKNDQVILPPNSRGALFAFEAVNLRAVDVRVYRVFESNVIQFLQVNNFSTNYELNRVGKPVFEQTVVLDQYANTDLGQWNTFYLDLSKIVEKQPSALYHVQMSFRKENAVVQCDEGGASMKAEIANESFWNQYGYYSYSDDYSWRDRDNPCSEGYYGFKRAMVQNFMVSDIGIIAKVGLNKEIHIFTTSISQSTILTDAKVEILDYQQQVIVSATTDDDGRAVFSNVKDPYFVRVSDGTSIGYLRLVESEALSYSHFPTDGETVRDGVKGFIYNERGVYRPGDTIHTGFMLHDLSGNLPNRMSLTFEFYNARGQQVKKQIIDRNQSDHYLLHLPTQIDDETGSWSVRVIAGNNTFEKRISVETVKPNRLKINIDLHEDIESDVKKGMDVKAAWLHGAEVSDLKITVDGAVSMGKLKFDRWPGFEFNHQEHRLSISPEQYFTGKLDATGAVHIPGFSPNADDLPSKLLISYFFKVFENNGNFSIASKRHEYLPYNSYVGLRLPEPNGRYNMYKTDSDIAVELTAVDTKGEKLSMSVRTKVKIYKVSWSWWWQNDDDFGYHYNRYKKLVKTDYVNVENGLGIYKLSVDKNDWGRYMVEVTNLRNNQVASQFVYFDWPSIVGRGNRPEGVSQNMLRFATEKQDYETGDDVKLNFPTASGGKALVSIENGYKVIESYWVDTQEEETSFSFKAKPEMTPNCYVNVHYIQQYSRTQNDLPLRLYGVAGINVTNPETKLKPIIEMDEEVENGKTFEIVVSEQSGKNMDYTIAIVDEGLLALTNFSTPNPYAHFFSHEALGVMTYDVFDWVIGAFSTTIERVIGIGGGADADRDPSQIADQRFKPIVVVKGPFLLKKNKKAVHKITLPSYIGEVRTMIIARNETAFGKAERYTKVKAPLMVAVTAPRKLVMNDKFMLPVNVFRDQKSAGSVELVLKHDDNLQVSNNKQTINFAVGETEKMVFFECTTGKLVGNTKFNVLASAGSHTAEEALFIEIYNPSPMVYKLSHIQLNDKDTKSIVADPIGVHGTNALTAEIATMPPFNLYKHFDFLLNYPHGCIEQTVSGVFGLVKAPKILQVDSNRKERMTKKIGVVLASLPKFQTESGGFAYWPGNRDVTEWGTNYAGHFMVVADKEGYSINKQLYNRWERYQKTMAKNWVDNGPTSRYNQAYRLYTLALAGQPEIGAMNRMINVEKLSVPVAWRLAAAYAIAGREKAAQKLVQKITFDNVFPIEGTYGSSLREQAMMLQTLDYLKKDTEAMDLILSLSEGMSGDCWHSTQTRGWVLYAVADFYSKRNIARKISIDYSINNGKQNNINSSMHVINVDFPFDFSLSQNIAFTNTSGGDVYLQIINQGKPLPDKQAASSSGLFLTVDYLDVKGNKVDVVNMTQTTDFMARIKVKHPGLKVRYENLALTFTAPGGWEIINTRFTDFEGVSSESNYTFRDFRDTQVFTYFDLNTGDEKVFYVPLNATYPGTYYKASVSCEAMYDNMINARSEAYFVTVSKK